MLLQSETKIEPDLRLGHYIRGDFKMRFAASVMIFAYYYLLKQGCFCFFSVFCFLIPFSVLIADREFNNNNNNNNNNNKIPSKHYYYYYYYYHYYYYYYCYFK